MMQMLTNTSGNHFVIQQSPLILERYVPRPGMLETMDSNKPSTYYFSLYILTYNKVYLNCQHHCLTFEAIIK